MSLDTDLSSLLSDLNLNEYEKKAYLSMLEIGLTVAKSISKTSGIPYAKVYQILDSLVEKGLIEKREGRPKKYATIHPKEGLDNLMDQMAMQFEVEQKDRRNKVEIILPQLLSIYRLSADDIDEDPITMENGMDNILHTILQELRVFSDQVLISSSNTQLISTLVASIKPLGLKIMLRTLETIKMEDCRQITVQNLGPTTTIVLNSSVMATIYYDKGEYKSIFTREKDLVQAYLIDIDYGGYSNE
ncbi:MAG: helix-turn-helix domain-containing protein [Candidatus Heimdallarchaeota archaeon]|nr:helix-turn-helix domain-containing protein [Candidatus Heimdallarchaeota archaeon]